MYYNRFRWYSADTGLYISQDPIGLAGNNPTLYGYVHDSNSRVDVFGLSDCNIKQKVINILEDFKDKIRKIDPDAQIGFRGSVATGHKGNAPFDPNDFDIDVFIKSDKLFDADGSWWQGMRSQGYGDIVDEMESIFRKEFPGYRFDPSKPLDIRIFNQTKIINGGITI